MEVLRVQVEGTVYGVEPAQAGALARKLRAANETALADEIDRRLAEDRDDPVVPLAGRWHGPAGMARQG